MVDFIEGVAHGETRQALGLTCSAFGAHRNPSLWRSQVEDERHRIGKLRSVTARQVRDERFPSLMPSRRSVRVLYTFTTRTGKHSGLAFQVVETPRGWKVCGTGSTRQRAVCDDDSIQAGPTTTSDP